MYPKSGFTSVHFGIKDIQFSCVYPKRPLWEAFGELCSELVSLLAGGLWCRRSLGTPRFCYRPTGTACAWAATARHTYAAWLWWFNFLYWLQHWGRTALGTLPWRSKLCLPYQVKSGNSFSHHMWRCRGSTPTAGCCVPAGASHPNATFFPSYPAAGGD